MTEFERSPLAPGAGSADVPVTSSVAEPHVVLVRDSHDHPLVHVVDGHWWPRCQRDGAPVIREMDEHDPEAVVAGALITRTSWELLDLSYGPERVLGLVVSVPLPYR